MVAKHFCEGTPISEVGAKVNEELGTRLNREDPWRLLSEVARDKRLRLRFIATPEHTLEAGIRELYGILHVHVIQTSVMDDVAVEGAARLLRLVGEIAARRAPADSQVVRIGFGGGRGLRLLARRFFELLSAPPAPSGSEPWKLPEEIEFQAMIGGNLVGSPTNPNSFFTYLMGEPASGVKIKVYGLPAPDVVEDQEFELLKKTRSISSIRSNWEKLDIIVSSAGEWADKHNKTRDVLESYLTLLAPEDQENERAKLDGIQSWEGDFLWLPVGPNGKSQDFPTSFRTMTLLDDLGMVSRLVAAGKEVLLVIGPCDKCQGLKVHVVKALLSADPRLITRLVIDSRTARVLVRGPDAAATESRSHREAPGSAGGRAP